MIGLYPVFDLQGKLWNIKALDVHLHAGHLCQFVGKSRCLNKWHSGSTSRDLKPHAEILY